MVLPFYTLLNAVTDSRHHYVFRFRVVGQCRPVDLVFNDPHPNNNGKTEGETWIEIRSGKTVLCHLSPQFGNFVIVPHPSRGTRPIRPLVFSRAGHTFLFLDTHPGAGSAGYMQMFEVGRGGRSLKHLREFMNGYAVHFGKTGLLKEFAYSKYVRYWPPPSARFYVRYWWWNDRTQKFRLGRIERRNDWPKEVWAG